MVCAVLAGLFLMHGAPATAAEGCHGAMAATTAMADDAVAGMAPAGHQAVVHPGGVQAAAPSAGMHGDACVSTPPRDRNPLPVGGGLLAVVAVLAVALLVGRPPVVPRRRGPPPPGGRGLLLQVCIART
jgi:hypothetical protein